MKNNTETNNAKNEGNPTLAKPAQQEAPKVKVKFSKLTNLLINCDTKRAERKEVKAKMKAAKAQADNQIPKWKKIVGWIGGGLAAAGAITYSIIKIVGGYADEIEEVTPTNPAEDLATTAEEDTLTETVHMD